MKLISELLEYGKKGTYVQQPGKFSKCVKCEGSNLINDIANAKNAELTH